MRDQWRKRYSSDMSICSGLTLREGSYSRLAHYQGWVHTLYMCRLRAYVGACMINGVSNTAAT